MEYKFNIIVLLTGMFLLVIAADNPWREWGNYTYFISDQLYIDLKLNYAEASLFCQNLSAQLASVHSQEETEFLVDNIATIDDEWFGLHHKQESLSADCRCQSCPDTDDPPSVECETCASCRSADNWQWEDGSQYDWTKWNNGQPNDFNNQKCAKFHGDGKWYDDHCSGTNHFICQKEINCYPHFCNSNGICISNTCVCNVGFTGKTCGITIISTSEIPSAPTDQTTGVVDLCSTKQQLSYDSQDTVSSKGDQAGALIAVGVLFAISLMVNIVIGIWLVTILRKQPSSRQLHQDGHVYYNSVVKSHKASEMGESVNQPKDVSQVSQQQTQDKDVPVKPMDATSGCYEPLHMTSGFQNTNEKNTYAKLQ